MVAGLRSIDARPDHLIDVFGCDHLHEAPLHQVAEVLDIAVGTANRQQASCH